MLFIASLMTFVYGVKLYTLSLVLTFGYFFVNEASSDLMTGRGPGSWSSAVHTLSVMFP